LTHDGKHEQFRTRLTRPAPLGPVYGAPRVAGTGRYFAPKTLNSLLTVDEPTEEGSRLSTSFDNAAIGVTVDAR
jgi:hypothetical protein